MTEKHEQELREFMRLKHHSNGLKNQQLGRFSLFRDQEAAGSNPASPTMFSMTCDSAFMTGHPLGAPNRVLFIVSGINRIGGLKLIEPLGRRQGITRQCWPRADAVIPCCRQSDPSAPSLLHASYESSFVSRSTR